MYQISLLEKLFELLNYSRYNNRNSDNEKVVMIRFGKES